MSGHSEDGSALVETILLIVVLLVPLVWMLGALATVHRAALGVAAAAREAGSAAASATDPVSAARLSDEAAATALRNQSLAAADARVEVSGLSSFGRGSRISVRVAYPVRLLDVPFVGDRFGPALWVRASHLAHVDPYRSVP